MTILCEVSIKNVDFQVFFFVFVLFCFVFLSHVHPDEAGPATFFANYLFLDRLKVQGQNTTTFSHKKPQKKNLAADY